MSKTISEIAHYFAIETETMKADPRSDQPIYHLQQDSRQVQNGDLFIALCGEQVDGRTFIPAAIAAGARCVLSQGENDHYQWQQEKDELPWLLIQRRHLAQDLIDFVDWFYHAPSTSLTTVGITGTNGKTTIAQLITQWMALLGHKSASIGTLGSGLYGALTPGQNTTPSVVDIEHQLADFVAEGVEIVALEISSHGLVGQRVKPIHFDVALFTNLSRDHLDFHKTLADYEAAKWTFLTDDSALTQVASVGDRVINIDDAVGQKWAKALPHAVRVSTQSTLCDTLKKGSARYLCATKIHYHAKGITLQFESSWGVGQLETQLLGPFNASNLLMSFAALLVLGYPIDALIAQTPQLTPVCGRMERFITADQPTVVVDYAHTPDGLEKALEATRAHCHGQLWVVFGCGGDRDKGKRPLMGEIAARYADHLIITNDNPRTESPEAIANDILTGITQKMPQIILDRETAIKTAIEQAHSDDVILIAGKGHEDYQIFGHEKRSFSDRETVMQWLQQTPIQERR